MRRLVLACSLCLFSMAAAASESKTDTFLSGYDAADPQTREIVATAVENIEDGMAWANTALTKDRRDFPLYCPPASWCSPALN